MKLSFEQGDLAPLIEQVVAATLDRLAADQADLGEKLAYTEPEAAALLSIRPHVLRDARLRGEIAGLALGSGFSTNGANCCVFSGAGKDFDACAKGALRFDCRSFSNEFRTERG